MLTGFMGSLVYANLAGCEPDAPWLDAETDPEKKHGLLFRTTPH